MDEHDNDLFARFERRFHGIEADVKDPPPFDVAKHSTHRLARTRASLAATLAVVAMVVAIVAFGPLISGDRSAGPGSSSGAVGGPTAASPTAIPSPMASVLTVTVGEWSARCVDVAEADCIGASERFINLLARNGSAVFDQSGGVLTVEARPACPSVPIWADGSYCWQVTATGASVSIGQPWCMVIARRSTDPRYPPYVHVGGPDGVGRAGGMPKGWPSCNPSLSTPSPSGPNEVQRADDLQGPFQLVFELPKDTWRTNEAIIGLATLSLVEGSEVDLSGGGGGLLRGFEFTEVNGTRHVEPVWTTECGRYRLEPGKPISSSITKSGGFISDQPEADFYREFFKDPAVRLPAGDWTITAIASFTEGLDCRGPSHTLRATILVHITPPPA